MFRKCCVSTCKSQRTDVKLHRFPIKKEARDMWLQCLNCDVLRRMDNLVNKVFICSKHFKQRFIKPSNRLKMGAYPTLFTELEISSGMPTSSFCIESDISRPSTSTDTTLTSPHEALNQIECAKVNIQQIAQNSGTPTIEQHGNHKETLSDGTPRKLNRKRLIRDVKSLTPKCRLLYKEFKKAKRQRDFQSRAKKALDFSKENSFKQLTKHINPLAKKLLWMQVKLCMKTKKARRFTMDEKLIGLAIYKQSPKSYKFLQRMFILPSKTTLKKMISSLSIDVGINPQLFELIKEQVQNWNEQKKLCTIMFDEMAVEPAVTYNSNKDQIDGFVHLHEKSNQFADQALVFMLRGAVHKWQQPIAFYFSEGQTKSVQLKAIIKDVITAVTETGLQVIALISDQGTSFQSALNDLLEDTKRDQLRAGENIDNTIHLCGYSLSVIYDPPHLIKGIRNNLLSKDILFEGKVATWQDIVDVYNANSNHGESRIMHKLTDEHVFPGKIKKMKVKNCVRVFSKTVSAALSYTAQFPLYPNGKPVSQSLKNTSEFLSFMDDLFDSVNGTIVWDKKSNSKILRRAVTSKSKHHGFWNDAIKKLKEMKFITKDNQHKIVPSLKNWVITLNSFKRIWKYLNEKKNIKIMRPRYFNSDPIENFFGQVRAYNYRSNNPSVSAFKNTFKSLIITRFINFHSESYNCEDDRGKELLCIQKLFKIINRSSATNIETETDNYQESPLIINHEDIQEQARRERLNVHSRAYTVGCVRRKILQKINCNKCKDSLLTKKEEESNVHEWIKAREYQSIKKRKLAYPNEYSVRYFGNITKATNEYLDQNAYKYNISKKIKIKLLSEYSFDFIDCESHKELVLEHF